MGSPKKRARPPGAGSEGSAGGGGVTGIGGAAAGELSEGSVC